MSESSTYYDGQTMQEVADEWTARLVAGSKLPASDPDATTDESTYGALPSVTIRITLAGGGPAAWIDFDLGPDADPDYWFESIPESARLTYAEPFRPAVSTDLTSDDAETVFYALTRSPEEATDR